MTAMFRIEKSLFQRSVLKAFITCSLIMASATTASQSIYTIEVPFATSPAAGASFHQLIHHEITSFRHALLPPSIFKNNTTLADVANIGYRLLLLGSVDFYLTYVPVVNQHEYFGHLARAKQQHAGFTRYEIYFLPPSGGRSYWGQHDDQLTNPERNIEISGGIEANGILADQLTIQTLETGTINFSESMLLIGASSDLITYLLFEDESSYNDIDNYLLLINENRSRNEYFGKGNMKLPATISFFSNALVMQSIYNLVRDYLLKGRKGSPVHMIRMRESFGLLPQMGYFLTPFGPEISFRSYLLLRDKLYRFSIGHAHPWDISYTTVNIGAYRMPILPGTLFADLDVRGWKAPPFQLHDTQGALIMSPEFGGMASLNIYYKIPLPGCRGRSPVLMGGIYAKTNGYTAGYRLDKGIGIKLGAGYLLK